MTKRGKWFATGIAVLIASFVMMVLLHVYGPGSAFMLQSTPDMPPMTDMTWMMGLGALAMMLCFSGTVILIVLLVRFLIGRS